MNDELLLKKLEWDAIFSGRCRELRHSCLEGTLYIYDEFDQCWQLMEKVNSPGNDTNSGGLTWVSLGFDGRMGTNDDVVVSAGKELEKCRGTDGPDRE